MAKTTIFNLDILRKVEEKEIQLIIADELKAYRKKFNYSQKELGEKLGVGQVTIARLEQGIRKCSINYLVKLCITLYEPNYSIGTKIAKRIYEMVEKDFQLVENSGFIKEVR